MLEHQICGYISRTALRVCDEVCWMKRGRRSKGETWWWNGEVKEAVSRKYNAQGDESEQYWGE